MKNCFFIFLFVLSTLDFRAQTNLVPNTSFEVFSVCPNNYGQINNASNWLGNAEYFNSCDTLNFGVPNNFTGNQFANTGVAYAGIHTYIPGFTNSRGYVQTELSSKPIANRNYHVEFYVSAVDNCKLGTNNMGAYFSDTVIYNLVVHLPQINNDILLNPLNSRDNWTKVSGNFVATGNEKFITIGNFNDDISTDTINFPSGGFFDAYYYIDDVSVVCSDCNSFIPNIFSPNNDNQNDYIDFSNLNLTEEIVAIYNRWGNKVFQSSVNVTKWDGKDLKGNDCSEGVYYYVFHYSEFINKEIDKKGFIQLVR